MSGQCLVERTPEKLVLLSVMAERIRMERCCGEGEIAWWLGGEGSRE